MPSCLTALFGKRQGYASTRSHDAPSNSRDSSNTEKTTASAGRSDHPSCGCVCSPELLPRYSAKQQAALDAEVAAHEVPMDMSDLMKEVADTIASHIQSLDAELRQLSLTMHANPEILWQEHKTHDLFVEYFQKQQGWKVTPHAYTLDTAWEAKFEHVPKGFRLAKGQKLPTVGFNSELDALPGIGHACGHVSLSQRRI